MEVSYSKQSGGPAEGGPPSAARTAFIGACRAALRPAAGGGALDGEAAQEAVQGELPGFAGLAAPGGDGQHLSGLQEAVRPTEEQAVSVDGDEDEEVMPVRR